MKDWDEFTGRFEAIQHVELRPRVSGYVEHVAFVEGSEVRKGDLLFAIDPRPYQAALEHAQAELALAKTRSAARRQSVGARAAAAGGSTRSARKSTTSVSARRVRRRPVSPPRKRRWIPRG